MRVIAGTFRSRTLKGPRGTALRPTSDRLRETLFNVLGAGVEGATFVDLYAGTGAVGIEALSRGAAHVLFVENHRTALALIRANLAALGIVDGAEVLPVDALRGLAQLEARGLRANIVFLDPPYGHTGEYTRVLEWLGASPLLAEDARVVVESRSGANRVSLSPAAGALHVSRTLEQGDATLTFYRVK